MESVIVMTTIGHLPQHCQPALDEFVPAPLGFCWRFVPEGPFAVQSRSILRMDARAVVVWVGVDDAVNRAVNLIGRLLEAGLPIVIAIAEVHDPCTESVLRRTGALYICANEARQRLGHVLNAVLGPPSRSKNVKMIESAPDVKMNTS